MVKYKTLILPTVLLGHRLCLLITGTFSSETVKVWLLLRTVQIAEHTVSDLRVHELV